MGRLDAYNLSVERRAAQVQSASNESRTHEKLTASMHTIIERGAGRAARPMARPCHGCIWVETTSGTGLGFDVGSPTQHLEEEGVRRRPEADEALGAGQDQEVDQALLLRVQRRQVRLSWMLTMD